MGKSVQSIELYSSFTPLFSWGLMKQTRFFLPFSLYLKKAKPPALFDAICNYEE
jgi:hypothetical protein